MESPSARPWRIPASTQVFIPEVQCREAQAFAGVDESTFLLRLIGSRESTRLQDVPPAPHLERMLRGAGLRVTRPRTAVLSAVHAHPHADTDAIIGVVRRDYGDVSHQAVYDVLRALTATGLVRRIQPTGSVARYEARVGDNHHHVVCRSCGAIVDVDCAVGEAPCLTASDAAGFAIDEAEVIYWGRCPQCLASSQETSPSPTSPSGTPEIRRVQS
jgi:Fur family ferric uptake transcriptional regulator